MFIESHAAVPSMQASSPRIDTMATQRSRKSASSEPQHDDDLYQLNDPFLTGIAVGFRSLGIE